MRDILAPHRSLVHFNVANTWHVHVLRPVREFVAKVELGRLSSFVIGVVGVSELEFAFGFVSPRAWWSLILDLDFAIIPALWKVGFAHPVVIVPPFKGDSVPRAGSEVRLFLAIFVQIVFLLHRLGF